jgi:hypothetical protein
VEEIVALMRTAGDDAHARRLRGLIVILWRAGLCETAAPCRASQVSASFHQAALPPFTAKVTA